MKKLLFTGIVLSLTIAKSFSQSEVEYDVVFTSNWEDHGELPNNAHFSDLAVAVHSSDITFFEMGAQISPGMEELAELGLTGAFRTEVNAAINNGTADQIIIGPDLFFNGSNRQIEVNDITIKEEFPLLSITSMIAPSPDWIVAANNISVKDANGNWIPEINLDLFPYDAGTEEGNTYSLNNPATVPQGVITSLQGQSPFNSGKIGSLKITLKTVLSNEDFNFNEKLSFYPNPAKNEIKIIGADNADLNSIKVFDVSGNVVKSLLAKKSLDTFNINLNNLSEGLYLLKFTTSNGNTKTEKLTISR